MNEWVRREQNISYFASTHNHVSSSTYDNGRGMPSLPSLPLPRQKRKKEGKKKVNVYDMTKSMDLFSWMGMNALNLEVNFL